MNPLLREVALLAACAGFVVGAAGCFKDLSGLEPYACAQTGACPAGFHCVEGRCLAGDPSTDGDAGGLAGDAGPADAGAPGSDSGTAADAGASVPDSGEAADSGAPAPDSGALSFEWAQWRVPPDAPANYTVSDAGTVLDNVTGLIWQQAAPATDFNFDSAKAYCRNLVLGDVSGWALPTRIELLSLVDATKSSPAINGTAFPGTVADYYWTSSPDYGNAAFAWRVNFDDGAGETASSDKNGKARCVVRQPAAAGPRYTTGDQTVTDNLTHLTWQQKLPGRSYDQAQATSYCGLLSLGAFTNNWRLPTKTELESLVDPTLATNAALDQTVFLDGAGPSVNRQTYRSSTPAATDPTASGWVVEFDYGSSSIDGFDDTVWVTVRCVHDE